MIMNFYVRTGGFVGLAMIIVIFLKRPNLTGRMLKKECAKKDAHLIVLNSYDENIMLSQLMYGFSKLVALGYYHLDAFFFTFKS
jgi:hypothetical protein